jgi:hypothetical protein
VPKAIPGSFGMSIMFAVMQEIEQELTAPEQHRKR